MRFRLGRVGVQRMLAAAIAVDVLYWTLWFTTRSTVASDTRAAYIEFENAFRSPTPGSAWPAHWP